MSVKTKLWKSALKTKFDLRAHTNKMWHIMLRRLKLSWSLGRHVLLWFMAVFREWFRYIPDLPKCCERRYPPLMVEISYAPVVFLGTVTGWQSIIDLGSEGLTKSNCTACMQTKFCQTKSYFQLYQKHMGHYIFQLALYTSLLYQKHKCLFLLHSQIMTVVPYLWESLWSSMEAGGCGFHSRLQCSAQDGTRQILSANPSQLPPPPLPKLFY